MSTPLAFPGVDGGIPGWGNVIGDFTASGVGYLEVDLSDTGVVFDGLLFDLVDDTGASAETGFAVSAGFLGPFNAAVGTVVFPIAGAGHWNIVTNEGNPYDAGINDGVGTFTPHYPTGTPTATLSFPGTSDPDLQNRLATRLTGPAVIFMTIDDNMPSGYGIGIGNSPLTDDHFVFPVDPMLAGTYPVYLAASATWGFYAYKDGVYDGALSNTGSFEDSTDTGPPAPFDPGEPVLVVYPNPLVDWPGLEDWRAAPLGTLTHAEGKTIRRVHQAPGEGMFSINRHSEQAAWCVQDNYVLVYRSTDLETPVFGFFIETSQDVVVSPDEEGGEFLTLGGRGTMAMLDNFCLQDHSYLDTDSPFDLTALPQDDPDGMWHWTRNAGSIMTRIFEECDGFGVNPMMTHDFDRSTDSNGDTWTADPDPPVFKLPVGISWLAALGQLQQQGLICYVDPLFGIHCWDTDQGAHTGITFEKGVNIRDAAEREVGASTARSHMLVQGDAAVGYRYRIRSDSGIEAASGKRVGFLEFGATSTNAMLDRAGDRAIEQLARKHDGPTTVAVVEASGQIALVDYKPGDYATVDIPGIWDSVEGVVGEVILTESETGQVEAAVQFAGDDPVVSADQPVGSGCGGCQGTCKRTETFNEGEDDLALKEAYVPGSVAVTLNGDPLTGGGDDFSEDPPDHVTIFASQAPGDIVVITYISASCARSTTGMHAAADPGNIASPGTATTTDIANKLNALMDAMRAAGQLG